MVLFDALIYFERSVGEMLINSASNRNERRLILYYPNLLYPGRSVNRMVIKSMVREAINSVRENACSAWAFRRSQIEIKSISKGGHSSVGRALEWHSRGQGFKSPWLHQ